MYVIHIFVSIVLPWKSVCHRRGLSRQAGFSAVPAVFLVWCGDLPNLKILWHFDIAVTTGPYGDGNFKMLLLLHFHPIPAKFYEVIGYHGGIPLLGNQPSFKKKMWALWNFNMGVNGQILKCAISWKRLIREGKGWKFGTHTGRKCIYRVLFLSDSLSLIWGHSVRFAKFLMFKIFKSHLLPQFSSNFNPTLWKVLWSGRDT